MTGERTVHCHRNTWTGKRYITLEKTLENHFHRHNYLNRHFSVLLYAAMQTQDLKKKQIHILFPNAEYNNDTIALQSYSAKCLACPPLQYSGAIFGNVIESVLMLYILKNMIGN